MIRFFIIIFLFTAFSASAADRQALETQQVTAVVLQNFPLQYITDENGDPAGFAIDVMEEIAKLAKLHVNYLQVDRWSEMFEAVKSGRADLMPNLGIADTRKTLFAFTSPVETFPISIFVREATDNIKGEQDLAGHRIAAVKMNVGVRLLKERENIDMAVFEDVHDALMELLAGKVDALIYPKPVLMKIAVEAGLDNLIKTAGPPVVEIKRGISVRKDNTVLLERLNQAVNGFVGTKEYKSIYIKWYGKPAPYWTVATVVFFMGGALVIAVVIMGAWRYASVVNLNRQLKGHITERKLTEQELVRRVQEMAALNLVGQRVSANLSFDKMVETVLDEVYAITQADLALLFIRKDDSLLTKGFKAKAPEFNHNESKIHTVGECLCGLAVSEGKPIYSLDIYSDPRCTWEECKKAGLRSFAALPLRGGNNIIAVLGIASAEKVDFEKNASFLTTLSAEISVGLQNSLLFEEIKQHIDVIEESNVKLLAEIAERSTIEKALMESEKKYRSLFENMLNGFALHEVIVDENNKPVDYVFLEINEAFEALTGLSRENVIGKRVTEIIPGIEESEFDWIGKYGKIALDGGTLKFEQHSEQLKKHYAVTAFSPHKGFFAAIFDDITSNKEAEEGQRLLCTEIASKNKELEQVVYVTSHDLRTPLVNIEGFSKELGRSYDELTAIFQSDGVPEKLKAKVAAIMENDVSESLMYISKSTVKMDSLLSGLLKLSRIGRTELKVVELNMNTLMLDIMSTFEFLIKKTGIKVEVADLPICRGDEIQIGQVFSNLIENAIKYTGTNTKGLIRVSGFKEKGNSVYCVEDNGIGIETAYKEIIFEIFHQLNPSEGSGEGLGLTIVQRAVERHHGKIWLESETGKGSSFFISLPS